MKIQNINLEQFFTKFVQGNGKEISLPDQPLKNFSCGRTLYDSKFKIADVSFSNFNYIEHVIDGRGTLTVDDKTYTLEQGSTIFIPTQTVFSITSSSDSPLQTIWTTFSSSYLESFSREHNIIPGAYRFDSKLYFLQIEHFADFNKDISCVCIFERSLHEILLGIAFACLNISVPQIDSVKNALDSLIFSNGKLESIIKSAGMSMSSLIKSFKKSYGVTPYQYLLDKKLNLAKEYLVSTTIPIKTLAYLFSFSDEHYFSYLFKKKTSLTPGEYRQKYSPEPLPPLTQNSNITW